MECEAILSIIDNCSDGNWFYFSSDVLLDEILSMADKNKREKVMLLYQSASDHIDFTETIYSRAKELEKFSIKSFDALHIASAEEAKADVFLTTDRRLINAAIRADVRVLVKNPLVWLTEVLYDWQS
jgi:predicted nucleic acid-binding protein